MLDNRAVTRRSILQLHVLLAVMLAYFGLYGSQSELALPVWGMIGYGMAVAGFLAGLFLVPAVWWDRRFWLVGVFLGDLVITTLALYFTQGFQGDLYLIYFVVIFMAGLASSIKTSLLIGGAAGLVYWLGMYGTMHEGQMFTPVMLMRLPFFFVVALVCSYFAKLVGHEQLKRREAQRMGRLLNERVRQAEESLLSERKKSEFSQAEWQEAVQGVQEWRDRYDRLDQRLRSILRTTHDLAMVLTREGRIADVNDGVHGILGVLPATIIGESFQTCLYDAEVREGFNQMLGTVNGRKDPLVLELRVRNAQDQPITMEWRFTSFYSPKSEVLIQGMGTVIDH